MWKFDKDYVLLCNIWVKNYFINQNKEIINENIKVIGLYYRYYKLTIINILFKFKLLANRKSLIN